MNGLKLVYIMFSLCVLLRVPTRLCALSPIGLSLNGQTAEKCIRLVCEKLRIFPYGQCIIGNVVLLAL